MTKLTTPQRPLIAKGFAIWLVVLAALPFTAPFATLDIGDIFGVGAAHQIAPSIAPQLATPQQNDNADNADDVALSEAPCQRVHPALLSGLMPCASIASAFFLAETPDAWLTPSALTDPRRDTFALPEVLRV